MTELESIDIVTEADAIAVQAQAAVTPTELVEDRLDGGIYPHDWRPQIIDLEEYGDTPARKRGRARFDDTASLLAYSGDQGDLATFYADPGAFTITAVFNDHRFDTPGWRDFTAQLRLKATPEWLAWRGIDRMFNSATALAEFIEDWRHTIAEPATSDLLDLIRTFRATKRVTFRDEIVDRSGDRALEYVTETEASGKGELAIPESFTLALAPFEGAAVVAIQARFRYRLNDGNASFGIVLDQPDKLARDAFQVELAKVAEATGETVLIGSPAE